MPKITKGNFTNAVANFIAKFLQHNMLTAKGKFIGQLDALSFYTHVTEEVLQATINSINPSAESVSHGQTIANFFELFADHHDWIIISQNEAQKLQPNTKVVNIGLLAKSWPEIVRKFPNKDVNQFAFAPANKGIKRPPVPLLRFFLEDFSIASFHPKFVEYQSFNDR